MKIESELLVKCGYADYKTKNDNYICWNDPEIDNTMVAVQPYADTLEGKRQAESLWNHLSLSHTELWEKSYVLTLKEITATPELFNNEMGKILYRIKWCCEQLNPP